jgi:hypothetical protein
LRFDSVREGIELPWTTTKLPETPPTPLAKHNQNEKNLWLNSPTTLPKKFYSSDESFAK